MGNKSILLRNLEYLKSQQPYLLNFLDINLLKYSTIENVNNEIATNFVKELNIKIKNYINYDSKLTFIIYNYYNLEKLIFELKQFKIFKWKVLNLLCFCFKYEDLLILINKYNFYDLNKNYKIKLFIFTDNVLKDDIQKTHLYKILSPLNSDRIVHLLTSKLKLDKTVKETSEFLNNLIYDVATAFKTIALNSKKIFRNIIKNLIELSYNKELLTKVSYISHLKAKIQNKKVLLIGASPSIEHQIEKIKIFKTKEEYVIFAIDSAVRFLELNHIYPDYVIILDPNPYVKLFMQSNYDLIFSISSNFNITKKVKKHIYLFNPDFYILYIINQLIIEYSILEKNNKVNIDLKSFKENLNFILKRLINIKFPFSNVGAFSLLFLKYLEPSRIEFIGIDYKIHKNKIYFKDSIYYRVYREYSDYFLPELNYSFLPDLIISFQKQLNKYLLEFNKVKKFSYSEIEKIIKESNKEDNFNIKKELNVFYTLPEEILMNFFILNKFEFETSLKLSKTLFKSYIKNSLTHRFE